MGCVFGTLCHLIMAVVRRDNAWTETQLLYCVLAFVSFLLALFLHRYLGVLETSMLEIVFCTILYEQWSPLLYPTLSSILVLGLYRLYRTRPQHLGVAYILVCWFMASLSSSLITPRPTPPSCDSCPVYLHYMDACIPSSVVSGGFNGVLILSMVSVYAYEAYIICGSKTLHEATFIWTIKGISRSLRHLLPMFIHLPRPTGSCAQLGDFPSEYVMEAVAAVCWRAQSRRSGVLQPLPMPYVCVWAFVVGFSRILLSYNTSSAILASTLLTLGITTLYAATLPDYSAYERHVLLWVLIQCLFQNNAIYNPQVFLPFLFVLARLAYAKYTNTPQPKEHTGRFHVLTPV